MALTGKTIDDITRLLASLDGTERLAGRDDTGDFKVTVASLVLYATAGGTKKEIDDADETILDTDVYTFYTFDNLTADRDLNLPTLADNDGKEFYVLNLDGSYDVNVTPEGTDDINDWNAIFPITEKYGLLKVKALSDRWFVKPIGDACIYEVSSGSDIVLANDSDYHDVTGMNQTLPGGNYDLSVKCQRLYYGYTASLVAIIYSIWGFGITAGNNIPDIYWWTDRFDLGNDQFNTKQQPINNNIEYYNASSQTIYLKDKVYTEEGIDAHEWKADATVNIKFQARRLY